MIELVLQCLIVGHKEVGPSLFETDLLCPQVGIVTLRPVVSSRTGLTL